MSLDEMVACIPDLFYDRANLVERYYSVHLKSNDCGSHSYTIADHICDCFDGGSVTRPENADKDWAALLQEVATEFYYLSPDRQKIILPALYDDERLIFEDIGLTRWMN